MEWDPRRASRQLCYRSTRRYVVVRLVPKADTGKDKRLGHSGIQSLRLARRVIGESSCAFSLFFAHSRRLCCLQIHHKTKKNQKCLLPSLPSSLAIKLTVSRPQPNLT